ncbi:alpha/beta hydrolase [Halobacteriales archaeon QS_4_70_19]|nr:MAG: alpha/beta hydrolase [Halobacteriales archaeon QS_4_70_19]
MPPRLATDASLLRDPDVESVYRDIDGLELHAVAAGDPSDPLVVLLHGFPEFWWGWREYVGPLVDAGYRVLAPDGRGYNLSEAPDALPAYSTDRLSADLAGWIESEGRDSARVVGHDWGAAVAWDAALRRPAVVDRLVIINVPHPAAFAGALMPSRGRWKLTLRQWRRSWYVLFFQLPGVPEWLNRRSDYEGMARFLRQASPDALSEADLDRYRAAWSRPGALTAMLDWYRAAVQHRPDLPGVTVEQPTLVVWGEQDDALLPELAEQSVGFCEDGRLERFPDASHWVTHERQAEVQALLREHLDG